MILYYVILYYIILFQWLWESHNTSNNTTTIFSISFHKATDFVLRVRFKLFLKDHIFFDIVKMQQVNVNIIWHFFLHVLSTACCFFYIPEQFSSIIDQNASLCNNRPVFLTLFFCLSQWFTLCVVAPLELLNVLVSFRPYLRKSRFPQACGACGRLACCACFHTEILSKVLQQAD